ncbi:hypothetical protein V9K67_09315 [Paraflavisolibacter sp. H34]|uniref:hypothetical protein n=1 Tax=Huijunlia imazamoxiresistens TaxID=3127457 RepID=UPI0030165252
MKSRNILWGASALFFLAACTKQADYREIITASAVASKANIASATTRATGTTTSTAPVVAAGYTLYTILAGQHYCDKSTFKFLTLSTQKFSVRFDSSGVYKTIDPVNQYDINKLYGFSEGLNHEYNSARIGWAYNNGALRLYAYAYKNGLRQSKEITTVPLNQEIACSIKVSGYSYIFTAKGVSVTLPRAKNTATASGYQLYPYFGGDEVAPKTIFIQIKPL